MCIKRCCSAVVILTHTVYLLIAGQILFAFEYYCNVRTYKDGIIFLLI